MKLLSVKKRKIAILFTSGLGDTVWHVPLMKELKRKHFIITCIFFAKYDNDCLFDDSLVDKKVFLKTKLSLLLFAILRFKAFTNIYLNHLEDGKLINLAASLCSKVISKTSRIANKSSKSNRIKSAISSFSDAEQNLHLLYSKYNSVIKEASSFYFPNPKLSTEIQNRFSIANHRKYFVLQISSGNNLTPFKNWPANNWYIVIKKLTMQYPDYDFYIIGDRTETIYSEQIERFNFKNCRNLIGKTSVEEVFNLIAKSMGYIGLDSGFLHIAVALKKKTLAIFGGSNEKLYGYQFLNPANYREITSPVKCRPCYGWKNVNTSRVTNPLLCPDFACMATIEPDFVFEQIVAHFNLQ